MSLFSSYIACYLHFISTKPLNLGIYPRRASEIQGTIDTGSSSRAMSSRTMRARPTSTFPMDKLIFDMASPPLSPTRTKTKRPYISLLRPTIAPTTSGQTPHKVPRNGSKVSNGSYFAVATKATASRSVYRSTMCSILKRYRYWTSRTPARYAW